MRIGTAMERHNAKCKPALLDFIKESKMDKDLRYVKPTYFTTTRWGAYQFGWPGKCGTCKDIWCIYGVRGDRQGLCFKICRHPDKPALRVFADDPYIAEHQKQKIVLKEESEQTRATMFHFITMQC